MRNCPKCGGRISNRNKTCPHCRALLIGVVNSIQMNTVKITSKRNFMANAGTVLLPRARTIYTTDSQEKIRKGNITYEQAKNIVRAGTIESLT